MPFSYAYPWCSGTCTIHICSLLLCRDQDYWLGNCLFICCSEYSAWLLIWWCHAYSGKGMECSDVFQRKVCSHFEFDSCLFYHDIAFSLITHCRLPVATAGSVAAGQSLQFQVPSIAGDDGCSSVLNEIYWWSIASC